VTHKCMLGVGVTAGEALEAACQGPSHDQPANASGSTETADLEPGPAIRHHRPDHQIPHVESSGPCTI
jgi:hypothetical protein